MAATDSTHLIRVSPSGALEVPAAVLSAYGYRAGDRLVVREGASGLEIVPAGESNGPRQFVAWRDISHSLLTDGR